MQHASASSPPTQLQRRGVFVHSDERERAAMATRDGAVAFEDFFPAMVEKLGAQGFMEELSKGFRLLMDEEKGVITVESLRRKAYLLGLRGMSDEDVRSMLTEGDLNGDGSLDEREFCVLMFRLSPGLMKGSKELLEEAIDS